VLDRWTMQVVRIPLQVMAGGLKKIGCSADQISLAAFCIGLGVIPALFLEIYWLALVCIVLNRIGDGLDGTLARMTAVSDAGGYLDIVLDFIFYSSVVFGFALADPEANGLAASALLLTFVGTGSSFLAFAIMAERRGIQNIVYPSKGIYYLGGLAEGTETVVFFILCCFFPTYFPMFAYGFAAICLVTILTRVVYGYLQLR